MSLRRGDVALARFPPRGRRAWRRKCRDLSPFGHDERGPTWEGLRKTAGADAAATQRLPESGPRLALTLVLF